MPSPFLFPAQFIIQPLGILITIAPAIIINRQTAAIRVQKPKIIAVAPKD